MFFEEKKNYTKKYFQSIDWYRSSNLFYLLIFALIGTVFVSLIIHLSRMPTKYVLSDEILSIDGIPEPIPIELYLKSTKEAIDLGEIGKGTRGKKKKKKKVNKHEEECRRIFQEIFGVAFPNVRPEWLINPITGSLLELDIYNEKLKLACEYDGIQHAQYDEHFHKNKKQHDYQVMKDEFKTKACKEKGIDLIRVPHWIKYEKLKEYIVEELKRIGRVS